MAAGGPKTTFSALRAFGALAVVVLLFVSVVFFGYVVIDFLDDEFGEDDGTPAGEQDSSGENGGTTATQGDPDDDSPDNTTDGGDDLNGEDVSDSDRG